jgi:hypothetical protein
MTGQFLAVFALKFYASLATGSTMNEASSHAQQALSAIGAPATVTLNVASPDVLIVRREEVAATGAAMSSCIDDQTRSATEPLIEAPAARDAEHLSLRHELQRKRAAAEFDVFLCHNRADKPAVIKIADQLEARGILTWLDEWELPPGQPWQPLLEKQIGNIRAAAVFVGAAGVGPWQKQELYGFLREFVSRGSPVIPVLLHDAPEKPELPIFLRAMTWVDCRVPDPDPLMRLIWGITGRRPER